MGTDGGSVVGVVGRNRLSELVSLLFSKLLTMSVVSRVLPLSLTDNNRALFVVIGHCNCQWWRCWCRVSVVTVVLVGGHWGAVVVACHNCAVGVIVGSCRCCQCRSLPLPLLLLLI